MFSLRETTKEENVEFHWGKKKNIGGRNKDVQFYESFTYGGVEYFLYDSIYAWRDDELEPSIGKLVKIWETSLHKKIVKIVWYFRPSEIKNFLGNIKPLKNEVFLASGEGKGLANVNPLEAISGKCNVICTSTDKRNPQASAEELKMADHIFFRTFDVGRLKLSLSFPDAICGIEVVHFFYREKSRNLIGVDLKGKIGFSNLHLKGVTTVGSSLKDGKSGIRARPPAGESKITGARLGKKTCHRDESTTVGPKNAACKVLPGNVATHCNEVAGEADFQPTKKRKLQFSTVVENMEPYRRLYSHEKGGKTSDACVAREEQDMGITNCNKPFEVTRRPEEEASKWFKQQPWEVKMQRAHEKGTLVLLEDLDPSYTSPEIEDLVWHALNEKVDAKMIQRSTFSSPHYGQALIIFKSKDAAETAISELNKKCLLTDGRPVVARRGNPKNPSAETKFPGHLIIEKVRYHKQREEWRTAVSTSHYSQPNTIEHEMALEWRIMQEKSNRWWDNLNKQHSKERDEVKGKLKTCQNG